MNHKILIGIAGGALALVIAGGAALAGPSLKDQTGAAIQATAAPSQESGAAGATGGIQRGKAAQLARLLAGATAEVTGLQPKDVLQELRGGKSLAQIAQEHGKTGDDVVKAARAKLEERLKQAVSAQRITQARADATLAQFDKSAPAIVGDAGLGRRLAQRGPKQQRFGAGLVKATAEVTGLQPKDVLQELRGGKSLAQIAQEHGKTGDDILAKLRAMGQQRLDKALDRAKDLIDQPGLGRGTRQ